MALGSDETALSPKMPPQETCAQQTPRCLWARTAPLRPGGAGTGAHQPPALEPPLRACSARSNSALILSEISASTQGEAGPVNTFHTEGALTEPEKSAKTPHS